MPRFAPYTARYAGYPITKGKLSMDVHYKVEDQKLAATNHLFIDQLTFGEKVESPDATKLPVLLAVSLLKNTRGEIDINLPISGSLNDPKFSLGGIIIQVIVNLIAKAITAPFSLLAAAFGGGEELGYVEFAAGGAELAPEQTKRVDTLARASTTVRTCESTSSAASIRPSTPRACAAPSTMPGCAPPRSGEWCAAAASRSTRPR